MIIYKVTCKINNKIYIGITSRNLDYRKKLHKKCANNKSQRGYNCKFYRAIRKHGWDNFNFEELETAKNYEELQEKEIIYIEKYNSYKKGYNSTLGGDINPSKCPKIALKISKSLKGRPSPLKGRVFGPQINKKGKKTKKHASNIAKGKGTNYIICSNGKRYESIREAAKDLGIYHSSICRSLKLNRPTKDGWTFEKY